MVLSAYDRDIVGRDSGIRGLGLLLRPEALAELVAERLGEAVPGHARITYLRYKPGVNCIARFEIGSRTGYAKAFGRDAVSKLAKTRMKNDAIESHLAHRLVLDEPAIVVSIFPWDAKLRSLARLADTEHRQALLTRIFKNDAGWEEAGIATLNYKPERRYVARLDHPEGRAATLKIFAHDQFEAIRHARKNLRLPGALKVPGWIGGSRHHRAMAYEWLPGETLAERLEQGYTDDAALAGEAIARLHASEQPALGQRANKEPLAVLAALDEQLSWLLPDLVGEVSDISAGLARWWADRPRERRPLHGDFYDRQVIIQAAGIGIIDTDSAHLGSPMEDLGCCLAHLERRAVDGVLRGTVAARAGQALRTGYLATAPATDFEALGMHTAFNIFKLTPHPFRDRSPDWPEQTRRLLQRCRDLMGPPGRLEAST